MLRSLPSHTFRIQASFKCDPFVIQASFNCYPFVIQASFLGCDILMNPDRIPPLVKDYYWDKQDCPIPYTEAAMQFKKKTYRGSADDMK